MEYSYTEWIKASLNFTAADTPAEVMQSTEAFLGCIFLGIRPLVPLEDDETRYMTRTETKAALSSFDPTPIVSDNPAYIPKVPEEDRAMRTKDIAAAQALLIAKMAKQFILYSHQHYLHTIEEVALPAKFYDIDNHTHKEEDGDTRPTEGHRGKDVAGPPQLEWPSGDLEDNVSDF